MLVLIWIVLIVVLVMLAIVLLGAVRGRLRHHYVRHFRDEKRERLFLASGAFVVSFLLVRLLTWSIHHHIGPFHDIHAGGFHLHHLVWGILLLLGLGYCWLFQAGTGMPGSSEWASAITATLYGFAAALTLDEFALWLRLQDVYWQREGHESVVAAVMFAAVLGMGILGGRFFHGIVKEAFSPDR